MVLQFGRGYRTKQLYTFDGGMCICAIVLVGIADLLEAPNEMLERCSRKHGNLREIENEGETVLSLSRTTQKKKVGTENYGKSMKKYQNTC